MALTVSIAFLSLSLLTLICLSKCVFNLFFCFSLSPRYNIVYVYLIYLYSFYCKQILISDTIQLQIKLNQDCFTEKLLTFQHYSCGVSQFTFAESNSTLGFHTDTELSSVSRHRQQTPIMGNACAGKKKDTQKNGSNLAKIEGKKRKKRKIE